MIKSFRLNGVRHLFTAATFFTLISNFAIRVNLNVAIVAMVNSSVIYNNKDNRTVSEECVSDDEHMHKEQKMFTSGEFLWSPETQGIVLGAFYYGYCTFQIIAGRLSEVYSGKWVYAIGCFVASILSLLTPTAAHHSVTALVIVRALQGVSQGVMFPAIYSMINHWLPDFERGIFSAVIHCGVNFGIVVGMTASGFLCNSTLLNGWPSAFYVFGFLNCIWILIWCFIVTDSPASHPCITEKELKYITSNQKTKCYDERTPPIPWRKIIKSVPVWALVLTSVFAEWCFYILLNELPTFFATVLHLNIEKNGFVSSAPFFMKALTGIMVGYVTDTLIRKRFATVHFVRKFCTVVACLWIACGLVGVIFARCDATLCVIFLMASIPSFGFSYSGHVISHLDLSPEYAGTLMGITNSIASVTGFSAPMFVGYLTNEHQGLHEWHTVFITAIVVLVMASATFSIFGSTKKQNWLPDDTDETAFLTERPENYKTLKQ